MTSRALSLAAAAAALAIGAGIFVEVQLDGAPRKEPSTRRAHPDDRVVRPAHGLMLFPLADPDGHVATASSR